MSVSRCAEVTDRGQANSSQSIGTGPIDRQQTGDYKRLRRKRNEGTFHRGQSKYRVERIVADTQSGRILIGRNPTLCKGPPDWKTAG